MIGNANDLNKKFTLIFAKLALQRMIAMRKEALEAKKTAARSNVYGDYQDVHDSIGVPLHGHRYNSAVFGNGDSYDNYLDPTGIILGLLLLICLCCIAVFCGIITGGTGGYTSYNKLRTNKRSVEDDSDAV